MLIPDKNFFVNNSKVGLQSVNSDISGELTVEAPVQLNDVMIKGKTYIGAFSLVRHNGMLKGVRIGRFASIAANVVMWNANHHVDSISTNVILENASTDWCADWTKIPQADEWIKRNKIKFSEKKSNKKKTIIVGNDCWIGNGAILLQGVTIGDGAVIGAGSVVTKDVPPYAIAVGNPARVVKYRFNEEHIKALLKLQWWKYGADILIDTPIEDISKSIEIIKKRIDDGFPEFVSDVWVIDSKTKSIKLVP
jgi:acetyltransferase-like isoleucine patch superfamily enzyme